MRRREFLQTLAASAAFAPAAGASFSSAATPFTLTIYFRGLLAFAPDRSAKAMKVMFVKQGGHKTVVVADPNGVGTPGTALAASDPAAMKFDRTWRSVPSTLEKWEGRITSLSLTPSASPLDLKPLNLFPLTHLSGTSSLLTGAALNAKLDSTITIRNGSFRGLSIVDPTDPCLHENQVWDIVDPLSPTTPVLKTSLKDMVEFKVTVTAASLKVGASTLTFTKDAEIMIGHFDLGATGASSSEAKHCLHYFDLLNGFSGTKVYPRRAIPGGCVVSLGGDPVYCPPAEI